MKSICVFCGSRPGQHPEYIEAAKALGTLLGERKIRLVYGGASVGLMGAVADAALAAGGEVVGVIPQLLFNKEVAHKNLTDLRVVKSMHERKALMADLSDAFIAMPGGFGTFEEFCEILTWNQIGLHKKPMGLLDTRSYYRPLIELFDHGVIEGFISAENRAVVQVAKSPVDLVNKFGL